MEVNFEIEDNYAVNFNNKHIDLHNNFDFLGFEYKVSDMSVILRWVKSKAEWAKNETIVGLSMIHYNVNYLKIKERDFEMPLTEDTCLKELTYFPTESRDDDECIRVSRPPDRNQDIIYRFQSEQTIRISCTEIELVIME